MGHLNPRLPIGWIVKLHCLPGADADHDVVISAGRCRDVDDTTDMISAGTLTPAIDASGVNGLDTGSVANNLWYSIWLIQRTDTGAVAGLFSLSETAPTMPANYDVKRRLGWVRTNGSANITPFIQAASSGSLRWWYFDYDGDSNAVLVNAGTATSLTDCPSLGGGDDRFAPTAVQALYRVTADRTGIDTNFKIFTRPKGMTISNPMWRADAGLSGSGVDSEASAAHVVPTNVDGSRVIQYERDSTAGTADVVALGWRDQV